MNNITIDFGNITGKIKPMHAVNNGPVYNLNKPLEDQNTNVLFFQEAGIPYARTHDASFYDGYGGEHTVDVHRIFKNFDADPTEPASYDFLDTDAYMQKIEAGGSKVFYRLGASIEHTLRKYGTIPPKDFQKWAVICEYIIRHYTEGWGNGFCLNIEYWEIWNEPDLDRDEAPNKRTWGGTKAQFFDFYEIAAKHLKGCFPHLKIGGPAIAGKMDWADDFLGEMKKRGVPMDFFSWHVYAGNVEKVTARAAAVHELLVKHGYENAESILNEWNYIKGGCWGSKETAYSHMQKYKIKGASFNIGTMCACQRNTVDMLMYYDARPTVWCGLFEPPQWNLVPTKAYYGMVMFNELYKLGTAVEVISRDEECGYICAAKNETDAAVLLTHFDDNDEAAPKTFTVELDGFEGENGTEAEFYLLDEDNNLALVNKVTFFGNRLIWEKEIPNFTCYLIKIKKRGTST